MKRLTSTRKRRLEALVLLLLPTALSVVDCTTTTTAPVPFARLENVVRGNRPASGTELQGLQVTRGEASLVTAPGMELQSADRIVTDKTTEAVIIFEDAYEVILATETAITISPDFFVEFGKAVVKKLKELRKKFQAETKYVNAGAKGTEFAISVEPGDVVSVVVLDGTVTLESTEKSWSTQTIGARQGAVVRAAQPPTRRERVTQAELDRTFGWARRVEGVVFPAEVPDLIGRTLAQARDELTQARLQVGRIQNVAGQPVGTVIRQSRPAGQRVRYGTTVDLDIAAEIPVPNVLGMTQLEAGIALGFAGFNVGDISEEDDTGMRPGRVARQYPQPGMRVPPGTPVSLVIASRRLPPPPPDERWCTVPDIRYASEESAAGILREHNLRLGSVRRVAGRRAGAAQNPAPGGQVRCGSSVDLVIYFVSPGTYDEPPEPPTCTVPDLRRVPVEQAPSVLRRYNLQLGSVRRVEGRRPGVIQNPEPGAQVRCGSSVDLVIHFVRSVTPDSGPAIERQPTVCTVPDIRPLSARAAQSALKAAGLRLGRFEEGGDARGQSPEPGSRVRCGTAVDVFAVLR